MALCSGVTINGEAPQNAPFKATQLWREIITGFRGGMPRRKKRVKIRVYEECFTGPEAVEWLHFYLQTSGNFGDVSRQQVLKLLQKFLDSDVIRDVRGKQTRFDAEGSTHYCFVTEPGPLNFVEDMDTSGCSSSPNRQRSPIRKHTEQISTEFSDTLFTNEYAFTRSDDSMSESAMEVASTCSRTSIGSSIRGRMGEDFDGTSPVKKCRSDSSVRSKFNLHHDGSVSDCDNSSLISQTHSSPRLLQLSPAQVASVWKDLTLNRLLQLVELETLEGVLAYDAVDGKQIASNFGTFVVSRSRVFTSHTPSATGGRGSTTSLPSLMVDGTRTRGSRVGGGCGVASVGGACSGVGSTHPHWLNRRFGQRLARVQPNPSPPPAANVHSSLLRSRSARKHQPSKDATQSTSSSLTLHHKLRYSIKHNEATTHTSPSKSAANAKTVTASRSSSSLSGRAEGGGRVRESVMDVPHWVVLAMKCLAKWPDGCTEEFVGGMPIYGGFELDVLQSIVQYFNSLSDPLISPKLYDLHMAVLRLVKEGKPTAVDALQLCSLLLPQTNRTRLHRVLRLIHKASYNRQLLLSKTKSNRDVLLEHFATIVLKSASHSVSPLHIPSFGRSEHASGSGSGQEEKEALKRLVSFMSHHYQQIFKMPDNLRREVQKRLELLSAGKDGSPVQETRAFCQRVSSAEYEQQRQCVTDSLSSLLDNILADNNMSAKVKKQRLKQFQKAYPDIYASRLMGGAPQEATPSNTMRSSMPDLHSIVAPPVSGSRGKATGRPLLKLPANHNSTDCLTSSKPLLR